MTGIKINFGFFKLFSLIEYFSLFSVAISLSIEDTLWHQLTVTTTGCDVTATMDGQSLVVSGSNTSFDCRPDTINAIVIDSGLSFYGIKFGLNFLKCLYTNKAFS